MSVADAPAADQPGASDSVEGRGGDRGLPVPAYVAIAVGVVTVITAIVLLVRRRRRKAGKNDIDEDWDDWSAGGEGAAPGDGAADQASPRTSAPDGTAPGGTAPAPAAPSRKG